MVASSILLRSASLCLPLIPSDLATVHPATADRTRTNTLHQLTIVKNPRISAADRVFGTHRLRGQDLKLRGLPRGLSPVLDLRAKRAPLALFLHALSLQVIRMRHSLLLEIPACLG